MRLGWAIVFGVLGGAALAWWLTPVDSRWNPLAGGQQATSLEPALTQPQSHSPVLFRWRDAQGVLHVDQQPPSGGQEFERVEIPLDRNIVPLGTPGEGD